MIDMKPKSQTFKLRISGNYFRQFEFIKVYGSGTGVVTEVHSHNGNTTLDIKPYKQPSNKVLAFLKFQWLKLCVHYS